MHELVERSEEFTSLDPRKPTRLPTLLGCPPISVPLANPVPSSVLKPPARPHCASVPSCPAVGPPRRPTVPHAQWRPSLRRRSARAWSAQPWRPARRRPAASLPPASAARCLRLRPPPAASSPKPSRGSRSVALARPLRAPSLAASPRRLIRSWVSAHRTLGWRLVCWVDRGLIWFAAFLRQVEPVDAGAQAAARWDVNPDTVASIILGGGAGTRLFPLTKTRAKPAVMIYRLQFRPLLI
jgi:hypothetical protein